MKPHKRTAMLLVLENLLPWDRNMLPLLMSAMLSIVSREERRLTILLTGTASEWSLERFLPGLRAWEAEEILVLREDLVRRGIGASQIADGVTPVRRSELQTLMRRYPMVWWW